MPGETRPAVRQGPPRTVHTVCLVRMALSGMLGPYYALLTEHGDGVRDYADSAVAVLGLILIARKLSVDLNARGESHGHGY